MPNLELQILEPSREDMPGPKFARIFVNPASKDEDDRTFVTPNMTRAEIDQNINALISKLEELREEAHQALS